MAGVCKPSARNEKNIRLFDEYYAKLPVGHIGTRGYLGAKRDTFRDTAQKTTLRIA